MDLGDIRGARVCPWRRIRCTCARGRVPPRLARICRAGETRLDGRRAVEVRSKSERSPVLRFHSAGTVWAFNRSTLITIGASIYPDRFRLTRLQVKLFRVRATRYLFVVGEYGHPGHWLSLTPAIIRATVGSGSIGMKYCRPRRDSYLAAEVSRPEGVA